MKTPQKKNSKSSVDADRAIHNGSGNVFVDMGAADPVERQAKASLAHHIGLLIRAAGLTQKSAAARLGIDQPKVSALLRGKLKDFSTERLMKFVTMLDHDVVISIRNPLHKSKPSVRVVA